MISLRILRIRFLLALSSYVKLRSYFQFVFQDILHEISRETVVLIKYFQGGLYNNLIKLVIEMISPRWRQVLRIKFLG